MTVVLGIDPGSRSTGYGVVDYSISHLKYISSGAIQTTGTDFFLRLKDIYEGIDLVLSEITADECAVEGVFVAENPNTALKLGQARGAALAAVLAHNLPVYEHAPRRVKKTVVGTGSATKDQVDYMVKQTLHIEGKLSVDAADALAVAICHARSIALRDNRFNRPSTTRDFLRS